MKEHLIDLREAETNLAAAAAYLAENIGSSDGHAEAMKEIVPFYTAHGEVDLAAELADTIKDNFTRDNLLIGIAEKCAASGDEEYAFQLAEAIDDFNLQTAARERIAMQKAVRGEFEDALKIAEELPHPDDALAAIAVHQMSNGFEAEAKKTLSSIEYPISKIHALQLIAAHFYEQNQSEKASEYLFEADSTTAEIELPEEEIRAMLAIAGQYIEAARFNKAIEILGEARTKIEGINNAHREGFLSAASLDFLRAGSLELADHTLDLIDDKTQIAATLTGFSAEFFRTGETSDALETLEEAYSILRSQKEKEVRDSKSRFHLLAIIAMRFAALGKAERALEIALENPIESERNDALAQIAIADVSNETEEALRQPLNLITNDNSRVYALLSVSNAFKKSDDQQAAKFLNEALQIAENIEQPSARSAAFDEIAKRFFEVGEKEKARQIVLQSLDSIKKILDESHRATALLQLAEVFEICGFELNDAEQKTVSTMIRKGEW